MTFCHGLKLVAPDPLSKYPFHFLYENEQIQNRGRVLIVIDVSKFACFLYLVCHEKPELMLRVLFTASLCVESSGEKYFGTMQIATPL